MWTVVRILALVAILAALAPLLAPGTQVAQVINAVIDDTTGFCERQPDACVATGEALRGAGEWLSQQHHALAGDETLTVEDRTLSPSPSPGITELLLTERPDTQRSMEAPGDLR